MPFFEVAGGETYLLEVEINRITMNVVSVRATNNDPDRYLVVQLRKDDGLRTFRRAIAPAAGTVRHVLTAAQRAAIGVVEYDDPRAPASRDWTLDGWSIWCNLLARNRDPDTFDPAPAREAAQWP